MKQYIKLIKLNKSILFNHDVIQFFNFKITHFVLLKYQSFLFFFLIKDWKLNNLFNGFYKQTEFSIKNLFQIYLYNFLNWYELELKGINYWYFLDNWNMLMDLGQSHFNIVSFLSEITLVQEFQKFRNLNFFTFNSYLGLLTTNFFWYKLKKIGPYKLKGFQFFNEWIILKEGKKPFK